jgi:hypothetical protein
MLEDMLICLCSWQERPALESNSRDAAGEGGAARLAPDELTVNLTAGPPAGLAFDGPAQLQVRVLGAGSPQLAPLLPLDSSRGACKLSAQLVTMQCYDSAHHLNSVPTTLRTPRSPAPLSPPVWHLRRAG